MKIARESGSMGGGFKLAEDGWHVVKFLEGIDELRRADGDLATNAKGEKLWKVPAVVDDQDDPSNEVQVDSIVGENKYGEQTILDFLGGTGLWPKFEKAFPGDDVSVFDEKVMNMIKVKLPEQIIRLKTKQNTYKDKKTGEEKVAVNIVAFGKMSDKVEDLEAALGSKGGSKGKAATKSTASTATKPADDDW